MGSQVLASTQHTTRYRCCVYLLSRRPNKQNFKMKISWPSGRSYNNVNWSNTGGARPPRPQPDNREGDEVCLAVLNNFYNDGVRFHDVSCHHRKPIICEA